jgi:hypothetical protein
MLPVGAMIIALVYMLKRNKARAYRPSKQAVPPLFLPFGGFGGVPKHRHFNKNTSILPS